jgi:hypothetical protein
VPLDKYVIEPTLQTEMAGDEQSHGNVYAPDIIIDNELYKMWYGGQSSTGHDSIHFATSEDGVHWQKYGVAIPTSTYNHVNDPSVVKVNDTYYMYYSVAPTDELDQVWCATSTDGLHWTVHGEVIGPSTSGWDSLKVGRPSVLYNQTSKQFELWFDGSEQDTTNPGKIKPGTGRHVGYATSTDGLAFTKWPGNPVFLNSGAIDVEYINKTYVVVEESGRGIYWRKGTNQTNFEPVARQLFPNINTSFDAYGHVTPFILVENGKWVSTYTGAATVKSWDRNRVDVWYPVKNITARADTSTGIDLRAWATSRTMIQWTFNASSVGTGVTVSCWSATAAIDSITETLAPGTRIVYFLPDHGHFIDV